VDGRWFFTRRLTVNPPQHPNWTWPLRWSGARHPVLGDGKPSLIFVGDMADTFHPDRPKWVFDEVISTIVASRHIGFFLTKFPERMAAYFTEPRSAATQRLWKQKLWLGFSAENQEWFDKRWAHMRALADQGWTVFCFAGPLLDRIVLPPDFLAFGPRVWLIASGEQGRGAREMNPDWARSLRDQAASANVPFFFNQMSGRAEIPADLFVREFPRWPV
jgi:protein gp37